MEDVSKTSTHTLTRCSVRSLSNVDFSETVELLAQDAHLNLWLLGWLSRYGMAPLDMAVSTSLFRADADDGYALALVIGPPQVIADGEAVVILSGNSGAAALSMAGELGQLGLKASYSYLTGPSTLAEPLSSALKQLPDESEHKIEQSLYYLEAKRLPKEEVPGLRLAELADTDQIYDATILMHKEETGLDVSSDDASLFKAMVAGQIHSGNIWCVTDAQTGELIFKTTLNNASSLGSHIEGVWVNPRWRRRGVARKALVRLCSMMFERWPLTSLCVVSDNEPAIQLYEELGFKMAADWLTVIRTKK